LKKELWKKNEPIFEAIAPRGAGVFDSLKEVTRQMLNGLRKR